ncbi:MAG: hypothetical protein AAFU65_17525, partial [Pseudomonadota bacterium]
MSAFGQFFGGVASIFDVIRKIMHFIVLLIFFMLLLALFSGDTPPRLPQGGALMLNLDGPIVE